MTSHELRALQVLVPKLITSLVDHSIHSFLIEGLKASFLLFFHVSFNKRRSDKGKGSE